MAAVDEYGVIELVSKKTPDTSIIIGEVKAFGFRHNVDPSNWMFDRGSGGKQFADTLRAEGYGVRTIAFGESVAVPRSQGKTRREQSVDKEDRYVYLNRRAQMYGELRLLLDPARESNNPVIADEGELLAGITGFGIPIEYDELTRQLGGIPLMYDGEGRMKLPPKSRQKNSNVTSLDEILGCSPDEADAVVLAVHGMLHPEEVFVATAF
jgi:hypothetical protein